MGDPLQGVTAKKNSFTVDHYGGSAWRWGFEYRFNYSRRDDTWQLVRVEESTHHTSNPDKASTKIFTPPKHFGKVDISEFDPETYRGKISR